MAKQKPAKEVLRDYSFQELTDILIEELKAESKDDIESEFHKAVDDMFCEMMNWAVRYALGRRTYAASDTARYMIRVMKMLDNKTIHVMLRDINEHQGCDDLGDECDAIEWMKLKESIQKEIERRKNNGDH